MTATRRLTRSALLVALVAAGVGATATTPVTSTPVILGVAPSDPVRSDAMQMLTVTGRDFQPNLTLDVLSSDGATTAFQVSLRLAVAGDHTLTVTNPDGGISEPFVLKVGALKTTTAPVLERVLPPEVPRGQQAQELAVEGQRFTSDLRAILTDPIGEEVTEVGISRVEPMSFRLRAIFDKAGDYELSVSNAAGEVSNVLRIVVR